MARLRGGDLAGQNSGDPTDNEPNRNYGPEDKQVPYRYRTHDRAEDVDSDDDGPVPMDWADVGELLELEAAKVTEEDDPPMDKYTFMGFPVVIENAKGSSRSWHDKANNETGKTKMHFDYGFIEGAIGADGEEVDVYIGPDEEADMVYVVHQMKSPDFIKYDEDKVMLGFDSEEAARKAYIKQYNDEGFYGGMSSMPVDQFRQKVSASPNKKITNRKRGAMTLPADSFWDTLLATTKTAAVSLENTEGGSNKFWKGSVEGNELVVNFGKRNTPGQTQRKQFGSPEEAQAALDKLEAEKRKKGYVDAGAAPAAGAAPSPQGGNIPEGFQEKVTQQIHKVITQLADNIPFHHSADTWILASKGEQKAYWDPEGLDPTGLQIQVSEPRQDRGTFFASATATGNLKVKWGTNDRTTVKAERQEMMQEYPVKWNFEIEYEAETGYLRAAPEFYEHEDAKIARAFTKMLKQDGWKVNKLGENIATTVTTPEGRDGSSSKVTDEISKVVFNDGLNPGQKDYLADELEKGARKLPRGLAVLAAMTKTAMRKTGEKARGTSQIPSAVVDQVWSELGDSAIERDLSLDEEGTFNLLGEERKTRQGAGEKTAGLLDFTVEDPLPATSDEEDVDFFGDEESMTNGEHNISTIATQRLTQTRPRLLAAKSELIDKAAMTYRKVIANLKVPITTEQVSLQRIDPEEVASDGTLLKGAVYFHVILASHTHRRRRGMTLMVPVVAGEPVEAADMITTAGKQMPFNLANLDEVMGIRRDNTRATQRYTKVPRAYHQE